MSEQVGTVGFENFDSLLDQIKPPNWKDLERVKKLANVLIENGGTPEKFANDRIRSFAMRDEDIGWGSTYEGYVRHVVDVEGRSPINWMAYSFREWGYFKRLGAKHGRIVSRKEWEAYSRKDVADWIRSIATLEVAGDIYFEARKLHAAQLQGDETFGIAYNFYHDSIITGKREWLNLEERGLDPAEIGEILTKARGASEKRLHALGRKLLEAGSPLAPIALLLSGKMGEEDVFLLVEKANDDPESGLGEIVKYVARDLYKNGGVVQLGRFRWEIELAPGGKVKTVNYERYIPPLKDEITDHKITEREGFVPKTPLVVVKEMLGLLT